MGKLVYKISWERYFLQVLIYFFVLSIILAFKQSFGIIAIILAIVWTIWMAIQIAENYIVEYYVDDEGVWIYSGLFPWRKGRYGLKWRDISGASYRTGFMSWILKSYTVTIEHRYTRDNHLIFPNVFKGHQLVSLINKTIEEKNLY